MSRRKASAVPPSRTVNVAAIEPQGPGEAALARAVTRGVLANAVTMVNFARPTVSEVDLTHAAEALADDARAAAAGELRHLEAMLAAQAAALNAIFSECARRAGLNMGEYLDAADRYLRLALRAQGQCRATVETLAAIKAGPASVVIARQANVATGPQQVNNGVSQPVRAGAPAHGKVASAQSGLLTDAGPAPAACTSRVAPHAGDGAAEDEGWERDTSSPCVACSDASLGIQRDE